jgi:subfamily B ATP-binding cassette protein MsbA
LKNLIEEPPTKNNGTPLSNTDKESLKNILEEPQQAKLYLRLLHYIKPYSVPFFLGMAAAIPSGSMDGIIAWLAGQGIQRIFIGTERHLIYVVPLIVLAVVACQGIFRFIETYTIRLVGASAIRDLRNELFCHLERQPLLFFQSQSSGIMIGRMTNDIGLIENAISQTFQSMISRTITVISLATVLILQSWMLSIIALGILSSIVIPVSIFGKKIRKSSRGGQEAIGDLVSVLSESIQGAKIVQSYNLQQFQSARFLATNQSFQTNTMKAVRSDALLSPILAMIGALASFVIALLLLYSPIKNIGRINGILQPALAAAQRVFEVLDQESNLIDPAQPTELKEGMHRIKFDNVYFQYPGHSNMVLKDINLDIPPGRMVALVGLSGSGKSTMANLVPRFFDVTSGQISLDGISIRDISLHSLRNQIALVTQDNFLFNTTVEENIRLGKLDATTEELESASKAAFCHDFVLELRDGYQTQIGERGVRLSGGQQQRLAIARAFLRNAPILILDEATSSLDNESEAMVQKALNNLMEGRTVIVIAHRLSTVRHADQIIVLEDGQIVETGTHQDLVDADTHYARLLRAQFERPVLTAE